MTDTDTTTDQTDEATVHVEQSDEAPVSDPAPDEDRVSDATPDVEEDETFPREYVEKLRQENGKYRQRAQRADEYAHRLHRALVAADGRLQDPTDLDFQDDHLAEDGDALKAAIDDLLARKPHLGARRPSGDVGQGATTATADVNLLGILRGN